MLVRTLTESPLRLLTRSTERNLRCSFCGKSETEVKKLIARPDASICNECIDVCNRIIGMEAQSHPIPSPK